MASIIKWSVSTNTPGFSNDEAPNHFDRYEDAVESFISEMKDYADYLDEREEPTITSQDQLEAIESAPGFMAHVGAIITDEIKPSPHGTAFTFTLDGRDHGFGSDYREFTLQPVEYTEVYVMAWAVKPTVEEPVMVSAHEGYDFWFTKQELVVRWPITIEDMDKYDYLICSVQIEGKTNVELGVVKNDMERTRVTYEIEAYLKEIAFSG